MQLYSSYSETQAEVKILKEAEERAKPPQTEPVQQPLLLPTSAGSEENTNRIRDKWLNEVRFNHKNNNAALFPLADSSYNSRVKLTNAVINQLNDLDPDEPSLSTFGPAELDFYLREQERREHEKEAIEEIQRKCRHTRTREGVNREPNGKWLYGTICIDCDKALNMLPSTVINSPKFREDYFDPIEDEELIRRIEQERIGGA